MTDTPRSQLERAYRLIQQEKLDDALAILRPIVARDKNNADAWWLMANAVAEPEDARDALDNVLRVNPGHTQARDLLEKLEQEYPSFGPISTPAAVESDFNIDELLSTPVNTTTGFSDDFGMANPFGDDTPPSFATDAVKSTPKLKPTSTARSFINDDEPTPLKSETAALRDDLEVERRANRRRSPALLALLALLLIGIIIGGALAFLNRPSATSTQVAANPTTIMVTALPPVMPTVASTADNSAVGNGTVTAQTASSTPAVAATTNLATIEAATASAETPLTSATAASTAAGTAESGTASDTLAAATQRITDQFKAKGTPDAEARVDSSALGKTLFVRFCGKAGPDLSKSVNAAKDLMATQGLTVRDEIQAIGVEVNSCASASQSLYKAVASIQDAQSYVDKTLNARQFHDKWK